MITKTVKGTRDYLPQEAELRDYLQSRVLEIYQNAGFNQIATPVLEDIDNLRNSEGGDNLSMIFEVMKRGNKLNSAINNQQFDSLSDIGLRYELTTSLCRYYANNKSKLLLPMKCIQIGNCFRAENPQRGRYREFVQCDIDIIGLDSSWAEVELIATTANALMDVGMRGFRVRINDRRILNELFLKFGFSESQVSGLCVSFDKLDKIGVNGIERELVGKAYDKAPSIRLLDYISKEDFSMEKYVQLIGASGYTENINRIVDTVNSLSDDQYRCEFDITLVRGQGYYTGAVFEVESLEYSGSLAGGGRYDNSIGKFINEKVPAVGFSIGLERVYDLLLEQNCRIPDSKQRIAVFFEYDYSEAYSIASDLRETYRVSIFEKPQKLGRFLSRLQNDGYVGYRFAGQSQEISFFDENRL